MLYLDQFNLGSYQTELDMMVGYLKDSNLVLVIGNGGSATMASHIVVDLMLLGKLSSALTDSAVLTAFSNDFLYEDVYSKQVELWPDDGVMIAISSSGNSKNITNGVVAAQKKGYTVLTFSGFSEQNELFQMGDVRVRVPSFDYGEVESSHAVMLHYLINSLKGKK